MPIIESIKRHPKEILLAMGARFAENGFFYIYAVFVMMYGNAGPGECPRQSILNGVMIAAFIEVFTIPLFGPCFPTRSAGALCTFSARVFSAVMSFPPVLSYEYESSLPGVDRHRFRSRSRPCSYVRSAGSFLSENVRYEESVTAECPSATTWPPIFAGALSPLIGTWLLITFKPETWPISVYMICLALIHGSWQVYFAAESHKRTADYH